MFIVFEGIDKSGKTTQIALVQRALTERGHNVSVYKMPDRTSETGKLISQYLGGNLNLTENEAAELFARNRAEMIPLIDKDLSEGKTVLCDRYVYSGAAYSKLSFDEWHAIESKYPKHIVPDVIMYLLATPQQEYQDPEVYENPDDLTTANNRFTDIFCGKYDWFGPLNVALINRGTISEMFNSIMKFIA